MRSNNNLPIDNSPSRSRSESDSDGNSFEIENGYDVESFPSILSLDKGIDSLSSSLSNFSSYTFPLLSDNFIISTYDSLTQLKKDHILALLSHLYCEEEVNLDSIISQLNQKPFCTLNGFRFEEVASEVLTQTRYGLQVTKVDDHRSASSEEKIQDQQKPKTSYSDLEYCPLSDGKSVLYRSDVFLSFILNNVQFEDLWNKINRHKDKKDILTTIFEITEDLCLEVTNDKQRLENIFVSLPLSMQNLSLHQQDDLVFIFYILGFDQDKIVKQYLLNLKQDWTQLSAANKDVLSLVLDFFPYEEYKEAFDRSFYSFQKETYVLSEPVSIAKTLFKPFESQLLDLLPQTIFKATTFQYYLNLYNQPRDLRDLKSLLDFSNITDFQRVMLAAKATMVDYEKEFSDLKVKRSISKLFLNISQIEANIKRSHFYDEFCKSIDRFMPKVFKGKDLLEKLEYLKLNLNNLIKRGEIYNLYQNIDKVSLFDNGAKPNFPEFAINGLLELKARTIIKIIDVTPNIFDIIFRDKDRDDIFAIIDSLIPTELIEKLGQNSIEVFKQKLAYLKEEITMFLTEPSEPKLSIDKEFTECLAEPELRKSSSTEYLQTDPIQNLTKILNNLQHEIVECLTSKPAEPKSSINKEFAECLAEFDPSKSLLTTDMQIDHLYDCFYYLDLCPNIELPDNRKLTTHISKYTREHPSSFSSLANSISSYDQAVRADSPSSSASDESAGRHLGNLTHPISHRSSSFAR